MTSIAETITVDAEGVEQLISTAIDLIRPVYHKMLQATEHRISETLRIFRACRYLGWRFVATNPIASLTAELVHVNHIPVLSDMMQSLAVELEAYKKYADLEAAKAPADQRDDVDFWLSFAIELPAWYVASREVSLICPSSAAIERVFSMLTNMLNDQQEEALEDISQPP